MINVDKSVMLPVLVQEFLIDLALYKEAISRDDKRIPSGFPYCIRRIQIFGSVLQYYDKRITSSFLRHFHVFFMNHSACIEPSDFLNMLDEYKAESSGVVKEEVKIEVV